MKIKTLIKELQKLDKEKEIILYPKYATESNNRLIQYKFKKRFITDMQKNDGKKYVGIVF